MIRIALREFIRTGVFGPVHLGMTDADVRRLLGEPDMESIRAADHGIPYICKYGDMELYYEQDGEPLISITMDECEVPTGGEQIDLDPWIIHGGLPIDEMEAALRAEGIPFTRLPYRAIPYGSLLVTDAGVEIDFFLARQADWPPSGLHCLMKSDVFSSQ